MFLDLNSVLVTFWKEQGRPDKETKIALLERMLDWYKKMGYVTPQTLSEEPSESLEKEMKRFIDAHYHTRFDETLENGNDSLTVFDFEDIARHFAKWGAEHLRDSTKMIDKSLEEAAEEYTDSSEWLIGENLEHIEAAFIAGAEWQKEQMLKDAYNYSDLYSWYIHNVSVYDKPLWSEKHLKELLKDFIVIPIEDSENGSK